MPDTFTHSLRAACAGRAGAPFSRLPSGNAARGALTVEGCMHGKRERLTLLGLRRRGSDPLYSRTRATLQFQSPTTLSKGYNMLQVGHVSTRTDHAQSSATSVLGGEGPMHTLVFSAASD